MVFDYLAEFEAAVRHGSLPKAADELGVSVSSLRRHLDSLESQVGRRLLERTPGGITPTEEGRHALAVAQDLVGLGQRVRAHFSDEGRRLSERVLVVGGACGAQVVRDVLEACAEELSADGEALTLRFASPHGPVGPEACELLGKRALDMLVAFDGELVGIPETLRAERSVWSAGLALVVGPGHPLCGRGSVASEELAPLKYVRPQATEGDEAAVWREFARTCAAAGRVPDSRPGPRGRRVELRDLQRDEAVLRAVDDPALDSLVASGGIAIPVTGLRLQVSLLARADDGLCRKLAELARGRFAALGAAAPAGHGRVYLTGADADGLDASGAAGGTAGVAGGPWRGTGTAATACALRRGTGEPAVERDLILPDGTVVDRAYVALRNRLNRIGNGLMNDPVATSYQAIMALWSVEDARAELEMPLNRWFTSYDFSVLSGRDQAECDRILEDMARRNLIYRACRGGTSFYCLLAWANGIWEFKVQDYNEEFLGLGIYGIDEASSSVYPTLHVCPVSADAVEGGRIAPYCDWRSHISRQSVICVAPCQCRRAQQVTGTLPPGADGIPMQCCLLFGEMAQYWIENHNGRPISTEECLAIADEAVFSHGLIPEVYFDREPENMCLCRADFCNVLGSVRAYGGRGSMRYVTAYRLSFDAGRCLDCGRCAARCPMAAIDPSTGSFAPQGWCVGCGQCALVCTQGARILVEQDAEALAQALPLDFVGSYAQRAEDRLAHGKVSDFMGARLDPHTAAAAPRAHGMGGPGHVL